MRRGRWGLPRLAVLIGSLVLLLTACSSSSVERNLRWGWPTGVTKQAEKMRVLWTWTGVTALIVGIGVWGLIFWTCIRHRKKSDELPKQTKYNLPIEILYSLAPFPIIAGLFYFTVVTENYVDKTTKNPDVVVEVEAFKWNWQFDYNSYVDPTTKQKVVSNFDGTSIPAATVGSSTEIPILVIPVNQTVRIVEHSDDVIHSFWVPEFLFKRDVIPYGTTSTARDNQFEITATSIGHYVGRCAELCGTYHSQMNFEVRVVSASDFTAYVQKLVSLGPNDPDRQAEALTSIGQEPTATTTHPFDTDRNTRAATN